MEKLLKRPYPHIDGARALMLIGLGTLLVSFVLARLGRAPFETWLFPLAWWSYILFVDGWVYRHRGESLIISFPKRFVFLSLWSVLFWLFFELINFRLQNWHYVGLPSQLGLRWTGYFLSFATVVPAILETADLLQTGIFRGFSVPPLMRSGRMVCVGIGGVCLVLPLLFPTLFFPLVWGALIFLLDPLNEVWGGQSLLSDARSGTLRRLILLMMAGLFCGFLWEFWNVFSGAHWVYTIPGVGGWKIFEMPAIGYLGFLPFAVSVFTTSVTATLVWEKSNGWVRGILVAGSVVACWVLFSSVDRVTRFLL